MVVIACCIADYAQPPLPSHRSQTLSADERPRFDSHSARHRSAATYSCPSVPPFSCTRRIPFCDDKARHRSVKCYSPVLECIRPSSRTSTKTAQRSVKEYASSISTFRIYVAEQACDTCPPLALSISVSTARTVTAPPSSVLGVPATP